VLELTKESPGKLLEWDLGKFHMVVYHRIWSSGVGGGVGGRRIDDGLHIPTSSQVGRRGARSWEEGNTKEESQSGKAVADHLSVSGRWIAIVKVVVV